MTYSELLRFGTEQLERSHCADFKVDAWYLLSFVSKMTKAQYYMHMQDAASPEEKEAYEEAIAKRVSGIPLQYITGSQDFMGLTFAVNPSVLIPRQDTETLVEQALEIVSFGDDILDMCTGSGCILISLLKMREGCRGCGADISEDAIATAKRNAKNHEVQAEWVCSDLFSQVSSQYDVIIANPPYIATEEIANLMPEVGLHEPYQALDGREDGLFFYRKICETAPRFLKGKKYLLFEIGYDQGKAVSELMTEAGFMDVKVIKDYCDNDRVVAGHL